jgi:hypothetical protein
LHITPASPCIYVEVSISQVESTLQSRCSGFRSVVTTNLNIFFYFRVLVPMTRYETTWMANRLPSHSPPIEKITLSSVGLHLVMMNSLHLYETTFHQLSYVFYASKICLLSYRKQTITSSILFEAISLFLNVGVLSVLGTKQALHSRSGF